MPRIAMEYAPVAPAGVTHIMTVGDTELAGPSELERAVRLGGYVAVGAWLLGWFGRSQRLRTLALGAGVGLYGAQLVARGTRR